MWEENNPRQLSVPILVSLVGVILNLVWDLPTGVQAMVGIANFASLYILVKQGTILKQRWFGIPIRFCIGIVVIGALFKIMHWPGANLLMLIGGMCLIIVYTLHFILKPKKRLLDWLKELWVVTNWTGAGLKIFHWPYGGEMLLAAQLIFLLLLLCFLYDLQNRKAPDDATPA